MLYSNFTYIFRYRIIISCLCCTFFLRKYCLHLSSVSRKLCQLLTCIISITISYLAFHCSRFERTIYENVPVLKWITITLYNMRGESLISSISFSYVHKTINCINNQSLFLSPTRSCNSFLFTYAILKSS